MGVDNLLWAFHQFVLATKLHPILVNFTAALVPVSVASDLLAVWFKKISLRDAAWWALLYATIITPFTALTGWFFWMKDDNGVWGMTVHKWLGTALALLLLGLFWGRWQFYRQNQWVSPLYLLFGFVFILLLVIQGYLGGTQVFSSP